MGLARSLPHQSQRSWPAGVDRPQKAHVWLGFLRPPPKIGGQQYPDPVADERDDRQDDRYHEQHGREIAHDPNLKMLGVASPQV